MALRPRTLALAIAVGLLTPVAIVASPAAAVDQDLVVSATNGAPGTEITLTSASCEAADADFVVLSARLISGTAPDEVLAGAASADVADPVVMIVPDWIDPDAPAVIEATCIEATFNGSDFDEVRTDFDPVPFDVDAGVDPPVQTRTFSRTSLQAGQAFSVEGTGCFATGANFAAVDVATGDDITARGELDFQVFGYGEVNGTDIVADTAMTNASLSFSFLQEGNNDPVIDALEELPTDLPAGTYTAFTYCGGDDGTLLFFEPQLIEITGDAPFGEVDLVVAPETRDAAFAGGACTVGNVVTELDATSLDDVFGPEFSRADQPVHRSPFVLPTTTPPASDGTVTRTAPDALGTQHLVLDPQAATDHLSFGGATATTSTTAPAASAAGPKALPSGGYVEDEVTPFADGTWSTTASVEFDQGWIEGYAACGDPFADGFFYDPQVAQVAVTPEVPTTTTPVTPPATAIPGRANYAG